MKNTVIDNLVIGQGLAGSALAWQLYLAGEKLHIVDKGDPETASRVSGGLITPMTGKKLVKSPDFDEYWQAAVAFYRRIEQETGEAFFEERPMLRLFTDEAARAAYHERSQTGADAKVEDWTGQLQSDGNQQTGIIMSPAGRLNVATYLTATRRHFEEKEAFTSGEVSIQQQGNLVGSRFCYGVSGKQLKVNRVFHCTGASRNTAFTDVPDNPSRGDVLQVAINDYARQEVVHRSIWIAPETENRQLVGSTYDWKNTSSDPTEEGKTQLLSQLSRMIDGEVEVHRHTAAVRPTMKDYEPVAGVHPQDTTAYILNGLGSKGALRAPLLASRLLKTIAGQSSIPAKQSYARMIKKTEAARRPLTVQAQEAIAEVLGAGDVAIDATVGNGFDTCFLADAVGVTGRVIGFDVQKQAIVSTQQRLQAKGIKNVDLQTTGHERLAEFAEPSSVAAIMFNLGYLPRSDKTLVTMASTSVTAISAGMKLLADSGVMTVLAYRGHDGGAEEFAAVEALLEGKRNRFVLVRKDSHPAKSTSPVLFVLTKKENQRSHQGGTK